uniref:Uncharacterized protein n=1 Tax=Solanum lycopersicum TaxID=4081 RepID=A0A3Q7EAT3_SOLLC
PFLARVWPYPSLLEPFLSSASRTRALENRTRWRNLLSPSLFA